MFERLATGWELAKQSFRVLKLDKELLLFPIMSGIACLIVMASFAVPIFFSGMLEGVVEAEEQGGAVDQGTQILLFVLMFLFYFLSYFVIIFFNSALVACAIIRLKGGDPTVSDGLGAAMARIPQIAAWAFVAASVGMILKLIESRSERVGQIVAGLLGMAWSVTTYFVVPILVVEKAGPIEALKRSVSIMKNTWGEALSANFGIGFITFIASVLGIIPLFAGGYLLSTGAAALGGILIAVGVIWILIVSLVASALNSIVLAGLYIYAAEGQIPNEFDSSMIQGAFAHK
ncbi:MAG: DUF6159 family protein [Pirellulaceae bacterium]